MPATVAPPHLPPPPPGFTLHGGAAPRREPPPPPGFERRTTNVDMAHAAPEVAEARDAAIAYRRGELGPTRSPAMDRIPEGFAVENAQRRRTPAPAAPDAMTSEERAALRAAIITQMDGPPPPPGDRTLEQQVITALLNGPLAELPDEQTMPLPMRFARKLANDLLLEPLTQAHPKNLEIRFKNAVAEAVQENIRSGGKGGIIGDWWRFTKNFWQFPFTDPAAGPHAVAEARARGMAPDATMHVPEARGIGDKATDVGAGLIAFVAHLALLKKIAPNDIPRHLQAPILFEAQNLATGGTPGTGMAMGAGFSAIGAIPAKGVKGELGKIGLESAFLGGTAAAMGGDATDVMLHVLIPPALRVPAFARADFRQRLRDAKTPEDVAAVVRDTNFFIERHAEARHYVDNASPATLRAVRSRFAGRDDAHSRAMTELIDAKLGGDAPAAKPGAQASPAAAPPATPVDPVAWVRANPQAAAKLARVEQPARADFKAAGITGYTSAAQRAAFAAAVRKEVKLATPNTLPVPPAPPGPPAPVAPEPPAAPLAPTAPPAKPTKMPVGLQRAESLGAELVRLEKQGRVPVEFTSRIVPAPKEARAGISKLKAFVREVPEFALDPHFIVTEDGRLRFQDGGRFTFEPDAIAIQFPEGVTPAPGQRIRIDLDALKAMKVADGAFLIEPTGVAPPAGETKAIASAAGVDATNAPSAPAPAVAASSTRTHEDAHAPAIDHGLPKGVHVRGPRFAAELMEATRRVKATARYAKLHPSTLGRFTRTSERDTIEVGDIRNQRTLAHELAHAIDFTLFDRVAGQSITARVGGGVGERLLREELKRVSYLYRGDPAGASRSHIAYRHSGNELMADYVALLIHDPVLTRQLAPRMTEAFEAKVAEIPDIKSLIAELHAERVEPTGPKRGTAIGTPVDPPGERLPASAAKSAKEPEARAAAEQLVTRSVRTLSAKTNRAFQTANRWMERLSEKELEDVGAAVEGIGNLRIKGDTGEAAKARLSPDAKQALKEYRFEQELARQEVNKYLQGTGESEYVQYLDDYLAHFYADGKKSRQNTVARWIRNSPNAAKRQLPTLQEAVEIGLTPITQNAAKLFKMWSEINWRVAVNRDFVHNLRNIMVEGPDGPMAAIQPMSAAPADWIKIDHPAIQQVYGRKVDEKTTLLWRGGAAVHPDIAPAVKQMLSEPFSAGWTRAIESFNAYAKKAMLSLSFFHHGALTESGQAVLARWWNPFRGIITVGEGGKLISQPHRLGLRLMKDPDFLEDAAAHGLTLQASSDTPIHRIHRDLSKVEALTRNIPGLATVTRAVRQLNQEWDKALWDRYHNGLKAYSYHALVAEEMARAPKGITPERIKTTIANLLNDAYGGQEWQTKFWLSPEKRRFLHQVMLAPDWSLSNLNIAGKTFTHIRDPIRRRQQLTYWRNMILTIAGSHIALQWAIHALFGDEEKGDKPWIWENEVGQKLHADVTPLLRRLPWHDASDGQRRYVGFAKQAREVLNWVKNPIATARTKASPAVHVAYEQITGSQGDGFETPFGGGKAFWEGLPARGISIIEKFRPFSFSETNFAFAAPLRRGMTVYKASRAVESALELYAEPNLIKHIVREGPAGAVKYANTPAFAPKLDALVSDILDAAQANGHDPGQIFQRSLTTVRSGYYRDFLDAMEREDHAAMQRHAEAIVRLHGGAANVIRSARHRGITLNFDTGQFIHQYMGQAMNELRWKEGDDGQDHQ